VGPTHRKDPLDTVRFWQAVTSQNVVNGPF